MTTTEPITERGLPVNIDAERFVLGSILIDDHLYPGVAAMLCDADFALHKHRLIWRRMVELYESGERIDRVTVANALKDHGQLESVDGLSYLASLDDGLPRTSNIDGYVRIVRDKSRLRQIIHASHATINRCMDADGDVRDILADASERLLTMDAGPDERVGMQTLSEVLSVFDGGINTFLDPSKRAPGLQTGFLKFDEMTGGLHPGELIILAARPAMGKTALACNIAHHVSSRGGTVAVFSLEMSKEDLFTRICCAAARVDSQHFRAGRLPRTDKTRMLTAAGQIASSPLFIDDASSPDLMAIRNKLRKLKAKYGLALVIVDYLQLMGVRGKENRTQEVSALSRGLKIMAKDFGVPFLALSQLSRALEQRTGGERRPQLSDLRESGSLEQDADLVAFIFREEVYKPERQDLRGMAELILAKQRNGPTGRTNLVFLKQYTKFENAAADSEPPEGGMFDGDGE